MRQIMKHVFYLAAGIVLALLFATSAYAQGRPITKTGTLADGGRI